MIVPMTKYTMLLHPPDKETFMGKLMDIGIVQIHGYDIEESRETHELAEVIRDIEEAVRRFRKRNMTIVPSDAGKEEGFPDLAEIASLENELEEVQELEATLAIEIKLLEPWGDFDWHALKKLEQKLGREVKFFEYPAKGFDAAWQRRYAMQLINTRNGIHYFIIFRKPDEVLPLAPVALPAESLQALKHKHAVCVRRREEINKKLDGYAASLCDGLQYKLTLAKDQLALKLAQQKIQAAAGDAIAIVEAWCPGPEEEKLKKFLDREKTIYVTSSPGSDETPPVLLKNNWFSRLFEPIGALFALPRYSEMDLTVFFAPFFLLFFGLCVGDVGYGVVILLAATFFKFSSRSSGYRPYLTLAQLLGASTILAGALSGTLFGVEMAKLPWFNSLGDLFFNYDKLFNLAISIGFIQIIFGISVQAYKLWLFRGLKFALSKIGWIVLLICLVDVFITHVIVDISRIVSWVAVGFIVLFGAPEKGWLKSIGLGVTDLYNITSIFGDLLSYIRLFALGVSSAILGIVVNSIALSAQAVPYVGFILFFVVLIVGHTANLLLSSLSAFVHPMRLTFVEFYKNSGFLGGGKPFTPLARKSDTSSTTL